MAVANRGLSAGAMEDENDKDKKKKKGKSKATEVAKTAAPALGLLGGPAGIISTGLSVGAGLVDRNAAKKAAERAEDRPKRRRLARGLETAQEGRRKREAGLATLSQAVMDWSRALR